MQTHEQAPAPLSLAWLVLNGPTPQKIAHRENERKQEESREVKSQMIIDALRGTNATLAQIAERAGLNINTARAYIRPLVRSKTIVAWRIGNSRYYSIAKGL